jgi:hypothetical protein
MEGGEDRKTGEVMISLAKELVALRLNPFE